MGEVTSRTDRRPAVLVLVGPTASGKTDLSLLLAQSLDGEIISADARQVYRGLTIGTAKPSSGQLAVVPHHFIDTLDLHEEYNAGMFGAQARARIGEIVDRGRVPVVVGGSGLYVRAVVDGLFEGPGRDVAFRETWEQVFAREGEERLREELHKVDPVSEGRIERGKPRRLIRALEVYAATGLPLSEHHDRQKRSAPFRFVQFGLALEREELYRRIDVRAGAMIDAGLVAEVKDLADRGYDRTLNALNTVGYREVFDFLDGQIDAVHMLQAIQLHTRQFARRQLTWFRPDGRIHWINASAVRPREEMLREVLDLWNNAVL